MAAPRRRTANDHTSRHPDRRTGQPAQRQEGAGGSQACTGQGSGEEGGTEARREGTGQEGTGSHRSQAAVDHRGRVRERKAPDREADGRSYAIAQAGDGGYKATCKAKGKTAVLAEGSFGKCYNAVAKHNREQQPAAETAA